MDLSGWWPASLSDHTGLRDRLVAAYDDPARGYHDLRHLAEVLARLDELVPVDAPARDAMLLAAWFHDAVYEFGESAQTNEERSADLAERELATAGAAPSLVAEVARLVRLTEHHRPASDDASGQLLCDADLAILAADPARYAEYVAGVRAEYADVPDDAFRAGRLMVLRDLLAKESLFDSPVARQRWEAAARANVEAEVSALAAAS
jgi:predicted metal-dependent HD superfamily phosphohydrolase